VNPKHLLFSLVAVIVALAPVAAAQYVVYLEVYEAGHLKPGYQYYIELHGIAIWAGWPVLPVPMHAFADAIVSIGGVQVGLHGDDGVGFTQKVYVVLPDRMVEIDENHAVGIGQKEYDGYLVITVSCPGGEIDGRRAPGDDIVVVKIEYSGSGGAYTSYIYKQLSDYGIPLSYFYEKTSLAGREYASYVDTADDPLQVYDCDADLPGRDPSDDDDTRNDDGASRLDIPAEAWGLGVLAVLALLALAKLP